MVYYTPSTIQQSRENYITTHTSLYVIFSLHQQDNLKVNKKNFLPELEQSRANQANRIERQFKRTGTQRQNLEKHHYMISLRVRYVSICLNKLKNFLFRAQLQTKSNH